MNVYFDLDGVLMIYDRDAYVAYKEQTPIYLLPGHHYFRHLEPDNWALHLLYILMAYQKTHPEDNGNTYTLSNLQPGNMFNEHFHDKLLRTMELIPQMSIENILFSVGDKHNCVPFITGKKLSKYDILIDDFNPNLNAWNKAGGTAIKYCNGLNTPGSYDGIRIGPMFGSTEDTLRRILDLYLNRNE